MLPEQPQARPRSAALAQALASFKYTNAQQFVVQVRLTLPSPVKLSTLGAGNGGSTRRSGVPPPAHLRRLLQQQQPGQQQQQQPPQPPPKPPDPPPATEFFPPYARVPVVLSFMRGGGAVAVNTSGLPADAGTLNTTRCIRYAAGFNASSGEFDPTPWAGTLAGDVQPPLTLYRPGDRPPLNLSDCAASTTVAATTRQEVTVQASLGAWKGGALRAGFVMQSCFWPRSPQGVVV